MLAQLLSAPAFLMGAISTFAVAILADRTQQRGMIMIGLAVMTTVGYCMMLFTLDVYGKLVSTSRPHSLRRFFFFVS